MNRKELMFENLNLFHMEAPTSLEVPFEIGSITCDDKSSYIEGSEGKVLIGSSEQYFLLIREQLTINTRYEMTTLCYRPKDEYKGKYYNCVFKKSELHIPLGLDYMDHDLGFYAYEVMKNYIKQGLGESCRYRTQVQEVQKTGLCREISQLDLEYLDDEGEWVELGSFGIREFENYRWLYGTLFSYHRFEILSKQTFGYHLHPIKKGNLGEVSKITEEYEEFLDGVEQDNPVLQLVELSDLLGAIDSYSKSKFNIGLEDLMKMTSATRRAFESGKRKSS